MRKRAMRKMKGVGKRLEKRVEALRKAAESMGDQAAAARDSLKSSKAYHDARVEKGESAMSTGESVVKIIDTSLKISNAKAAKPLSWLERLMLKFAVAKAFADGYAEDIPTMLREVRAAFGEINRA